MSPQVPPRAFPLMPWRRPSPGTEPWSLRRALAAMSRPRAWGLALGGLLLSCAAEPGEPVPAPKSRGQSVASPDGDLTVTGPQILNRYAALTADAAAGATVLRVDPGALSALGLQAGDLLLVAQVQGATIDTAAASPSHGTVTALGGTNGQAGRFELVNVTAVNPTTGVVTVSAQCGGLRNAYSTGGHSQIVRVPQYGLLTIGAGGSVAAQAWDGSVGGIVALRAQHVHLDSGGRISADGAGFRAGIAASPSGNKLVASDVTSFSSGSLDEGAAKGEGIAGWLTSYGRGAAGNGGGGGNAYGAGGGGGANAGVATGWAGNGVMRAGSVAEAAAWGLDPAGALALSNEGGGGRGGYSLSTSDQDALGLAPGNSQWGGNYRRERGGRGGYPLSNSAALQLFLGGGGGAGDRIDAAPVSGPEGSGGRGGGLVYLLADLVDGAGSLSARGASGVSTSAGTQGGAGGGGGGGSIVVNALALRGSVAVSADGGDGGSQSRVGATPFTAAMGPGGGGGGGFIALPSGTPNTVTARALGGRAGSSQADTVSEFPGNGATDGHAGPAVASLTAGAGGSPLCAPVDLRIAVTGANAQVAPDSETSFLISVANDGPYTAIAAPVTATLTPRGDFVDWICSVDSGNASDSATQTQASCSPGIGINAVNTALTLPPGGRASILLRAIIPVDLRGPLTCSATVAAASIQSDLNLSNNAANATMTVVEQADLALTSTVAPSPTKSGQSLTYLLSLRNEGPNTASGVTLTFFVPENATLLDGFAPFGDGWACEVAPSRTQGVCRRDSLDRGPAPDVTLALSPSFAATSVVVQATASAASLDPDLSNNDSAATADIAYDVTRYRRGVFGGGGFSCRVVAPGSPPAGSDPSLFVLLGLLAGSLLARRLPRSRQPARDFRPSSANPNEECLCDLPSISLSSRR